MDLRRPDAQTDGGAGAVLPAHQGERLRRFMKVMELKANSSNNTLFADDKGDIAYLHPQFVPRRDNRFDYTKPVDGADPATDWKGLHALEEAAARAQSAERLGLQHQRLALLRRRPLQPEARELSRATWTPPARTRAASMPPTLLRIGRTSRWMPDRRGLRPLSAGVRAACIPSLLAAYDSSTAAIPLKAQLGGPDRRAARLGRSLGRATRSPRRWPCSGAMSSGIRSGTRRDAHLPVYEMADHSRRRAEAGGAGAPSSIGCRATSAPGACRGARSTASSA